MESSAQDGSSPPDDMGSAAASSGGRRRGPAHPNAKLTQEQVAQIRASRMGPSELARLFQVSKATISLIRAGKLWASEPPSPPAAPEPEPATALGGLAAVRARDEQSESRPGPRVGFSTAEERR